jgi:hypothetical protein
MHTMTADSAASGLTTNTNQGPGCEIAGALLTTASLIDTTTPQTVAHLLERLLEALWNEEQLPSARDFNVQAVHLLGRTQAPQRMSSPSTRQPQASKTCSSWMDASAQHRLEDAWAYG